MIIARAPLRVTFGSGVVDVLARAGGPPAAVISAAVDIHVYATAHLRRDSRVVASYSSLEIVDSTAAVENKLVRAVLEVAGFDHGIELHFVSEIPIGASGMGGSAAAAAAALMAVWGLRGWHIEGPQLAERAAKIEIDVLGRKVGKQDHYAAAVGGLQRISFDGSAAKSSPLQHSFLAPIEGCCILAPCLDGPRDASELLAEQVASPVAAEIAARLARIAADAEAAFQARDVSRLSAAVNSAWDAKRLLSPAISSPIVDAAVSAIRSLGGAAKLCGAGGGGYVFGILPAGRIGGALKALPGSFQVDFCPHGAEMVFDSGSRDYREDLLP